MSRSYDIGAGGDPAKTGKIVGEVETPGGGTALVNILKKFANAPSFVMVMEPVHPTLVGLCSLRRSDAALCAAQLVWGFLIENMRIERADWGPLGWSCAEYLAAGGKKNDWDRGLRFLLDAGVVKRKSGKLLLAPIHAYRGRLDDWFPATEKYATIKSK